MIEFPQKGIRNEDIINQLNAMKSMDADWKNARIFSLVFNAGNEVKEFAEKAFNTFINENSLSPFTFPSLLRMENEVVAMMINLLGGNADTVGNMTTGGTESLMSAVKAARDYARENKPEITDPQLVMPLSAHPSINKAAHYLGIKTVIVPTDNCSVVKPDDIRASLNKNTIMLIASAPSYPHGIIDPIKEIAGIAAENNIWFHVDACVGGMVLPFLKNAGYHVPDFDLRIPGVWSISADIHKYGYSPKGASIILYRDDNLRKYQMFAYTEWPGGIYATTSVAGSRSGGPISASWGLIKYLGFEGYMRLADTAMKAVKLLQSGINSIPGLHVIGNPVSTIFAIGSDSYNIYAIGDMMKSRGWYLDSQQKPPSLHMTIMPEHIKIVENFIKDLREVTSKVAGLKEGEMGGDAALYEIINSVPDKRESTALAIQFLNDMYKVGK